MMRFWRKTERKHARPGSRLHCETLEERRVLSVSPIIVPVTPPSINDLPIQTITLPPEFWNPNPFLTDRQMLVSDGEQSDDGAVLFSPDRLIVSFNRAADTTGGASGDHSILNPANWRLTHDGVDVSSLIASIEFTSDTFIATVMLSTPLGPGSYDVTVRDTIHDLAGNALDGDNNKVPGGDAVEAFSVATVVVAGPQEQVWLGMNSSSAVATDAAGNYVIVGIRTGYRDPYGMPIMDPLPRGLVAQRYRADGTPLGELISIDNTLWSLSDISVAMNASGEFVVSWTDYVEVEGRSVVFAQRFNANGTTGSEVVRISQGTSTAELTSQPRSVQGQDVGIDVAGNLVVLWRSVDTTTSIGDLYVTFVASHGMKLGDVFVATGAESANLALNENGHFAVSWLSKFMDDPDSSDPNLFAQQVYLRVFGPDGAPLGGAQRVDLGGINQGSDVAIDPQGNVVVAWSHAGVDGESVMARRFNASGESLGNPITVVDVGPSASSSEGNYYDVRVAIDAAGRFAVSWTEWSIPLPRWLSVNPPFVDLDPTIELTNSASPSAKQFYPPVTTGLYVPNELLRAQMFDADGQRYGEIFDINRNAEPLGNTSIAMDADGDLVAVWSSRGYSYPAIIVTPGYWPPGYNTSIVYSRRFSPRDELVLDLNGPAPSTDFMANYQPGGAAVSIVDPALEIRSFGTPSLTAATAFIFGALDGDVLSADTTGTNITASYVDGILALLGADTLANYEKVLRTIQFSSTADRAPGSNVRVQFIVSDGEQLSNLAESIVSIYQPGLSSIVGRRLFYNNSSYDGRDPAANASDDAAIATDKTALQVGDAASFANYSSYHRGINGIMLDIVGGHGAITANDFQFRIGNSNNSSTWAYAPAPLSIIVRAGAGAGGSDRVEILWADFAIVNTWLEVAVAANGNTGLAQSDTFYFGNAVGETGNSTAGAQVNATDFLNTLNFIFTAGSSTDITTAYDFNRDGAVNAQDFLISLHQILTTRPTLNLIAPPSSSVSSSWGLFISSWTPEFYLFDHPLEVVGTITAPSQAYGSVAAADLASDAPQASAASAAYWAAQADDDNRDAEDEESEDWLDALLPTGG